MEEVQSLRRPKSALVLFAGLLAVLASACLDPLVSDAPLRPGLLLTSDAVVPSATDDPSVRARVAAFDGVEGDIIPLRSGFGGGGPVRYWDFGEASPEAIPLYLVVREVATGGIFETESGQYSLIGHPPIFDAIPGDPAYTPWWSVFLLPVAARWDDQLLPSFEAVDEAIRQGLVDVPIALPVAANCPVVLPEARLEAPDGTLTPPSRAFYKGTWVHYFDLGVAPLLEGRVPVADAWTLRREGGEPLSEPHRGVDMTGDGDLHDTNDIFSALPGDEAYSGLVAVTEAVVAADIESIDTRGTDLEAALMGVSDLFGGEDAAPTPGVVRALYPAGTILNRPIAPAETGEESE